MLLLTSCKKSEKKFKKSIYSKTNQTCESRKSWRCSLSHFSLLESLKKVNFPQTCNQGCNHNPVKHLRWNILQKSYWHSAINYFHKKDFHIISNIFTFDWVLNMTLINAWYCHRKQNWAPFWQIFISHFE